MLQAALSDWGCRRIYAVCIQRRVPWILKEKRYSMRGVITPKQNILFRGGGFMRLPLFASAQING